MSFSQPHEPSLPEDTIWFGSRDFIKAADVHMKSTNAVWPVESFLKHLGSFPICHEKIVGSSLYGFPVTVLVRVTTCLTWS